MLVSWVILVIVVILVIKVFICFGRGICFLLLSENIFIKLKLYLFCGSSLCEAKVSCVR